MNSTPDLSPLIKGVLALIGIAIALGQYPKLEHWARAQALEPYNGSKVFRTFSRLRVPRRNTVI